MSAPAMLMKAAAGPEFASCKVLVRHQLLNMTGKSPAQAHRAL
jgi:hypothetical protein